MRPPRRRRTRALLDAALEGIEKLNARYAPERQKDAAAAPRFTCFTVVASGTSENKWIGWERKRGKLEEFNRLLRGAQDTSFVVADADAALLTVFVT